MDVSAEDVVFPWAFPSHEPGTGHTCSVSAYLMTKYTNGFTQPRASQVLSFILCVAESTARWTRCVLIPGTHAPINHASSYACGPCPLLVFPVAAAVRWHLEKGGVSLSAGASGLMPRPPGPLRTAQTSPRARRLSDVSASWHGWLQLRV